MLIVQSVGRRLRRLAPVLGVAAAAACGAFHRGAAPSSEPAVIVFANQSLDQADVFAVVQGANAVRLGTVMAGRTESLLVPADLSSRGASINIVARLLARNIAPATGAVSIYGGERYEVTLGADERILSFLPARDR